MIKAIISLPLPTWKFYPLRPLTRPPCAASVHGYDTAIIIIEVSSTAPLRRADTLQHQLLITHYHGGLYTGTSLYVSQTVLAFLPKRNKAFAAGVPTGSSSPPRETHSSFSTQFYSLSLVVFSQMFFH